jgi:hypothetical protein
VIKEFAELDKEVMSFLCEETYEARAIRSAIKSSKDSLISILRTNNLYPPNMYAGKIADAVIALYGSRDQDSVELFFDDIELLAVEREIEETDKDLEEQSEDLEELLEDNYEQDFEDKTEINKIDSSLKIADDDLVDGDDEK